MGTVFACWSFRPTPVEAQGHDETKSISFGESQNPVLIVRQMRIYESTSPVKHEPRMSGHCEWGIWMGGMGRCGGEAYGYGKVSRRRASARERERDIERGGERQRERLRKK